MKKKNINVIFPKSKSMGYRNWGVEKVIAVIPKILSLKLLVIKKGKRGGLQYHHKKNECGYIISGKLKINFDNGKGKLIYKILKKGDSFHFPPGAIHQEEAITNCKIVEASTPHYNDRVRVENKYHIKTNGGMPSTTRLEVKTYK
jgi:mannose-6-phosphate isomerase